ncbi:MAG: Ig-like domain-containing protein, partial [Anaerolineaceae bacterium]|nr:Ig-like domain-containing protein [Anaerolineaceae bacterium]
MNTDKKSWLNPRNAFVMIVIILAVIGLTYKAVTLIRPAIGGTTPMPYTIDKGTPEPGNGIAGKSGEDYSVKVGLSEGQAQTETPEPRTVTTGEPLTSEEIAAIFARLPTLPVSPGEQTEFNYPVELLPPPRPGETIKETFPSHDVLPTPAVVSGEALEVLRFAPEGEIPIAPFVSITFNQPMVPLGTLGDLAAEFVPVQIDPPLSGTWRWLGTKTLTFEYDSELIDRLPKATGYTVTIPAGTKSATGGVLAETVTWTFSTPAPKVITMYPQNIPQPLAPLIFIAFDQRIDPGAVLKTIQLYAGNELYGVTLASQAEIAKDKEVSQYVKNAQDGRWLVFKASKPFPKDTSISITVGPGTPSAEGPLVTTTAQSFSFFTYPPLRILNYGCYWSDDPCPPLTPFNIRFNNSLDTEAFSEDMLRVTPAIPGMVVNIYGDTIVISGETKGQTTYT